MRIQVPGESKLAGWSPSSAFSLSLPLESHLSQLCCCGQRAVHELRIHAELITTGVTLQRIDADACGLSAFKVRALILRGCS